MKRSLLAFVLLLLLLPLYSEGAVTFTWSHSDSDVSQYRWRKGDGEWNVVSASDDLVAVSPYRMGDTESYQIEASYDGIRWSEDNNIVVSPSETLLVTWSWKEQDGVPFYRWRMDGGEWTETEVATTGSIEVANGGKHTLEVQASYDGVNWSGSTKSLITAVSSRRDGERIGLELRSSLSLSYGAYHFYNGSHIPGARYLTTTKPGLTAGAGISLSLSKHLRVNGEYSYTLLEKRETVIPDAFRVEHHQAGFGFDVLLPINERWRAYLGLTSDYSVDINAGMWSPSSFIGAVFGVEYFINKNAYIGLSTGIKAAHNDDSDPLYRSITYLAEPISAVVGVRF